MNHEQARDILDQVAVLRRALASLDLCGPGDPVALKIRRDIDVAARRLMESGGGPAVAAAITVLIDHHTAG